MFTDENGILTEDFKTQLPTILGEEYKDFKGFDDIKDIQTLAKNYANTKSAYGKKLENVIQKPAKDAKPEEVAAYRQSLLSELGGVKSVDDLKDINWRAGIKDGVAIDDNLVKGISEFAAKKGYPKSMIKELVEEFYNPVMMSAYEQQQAAIKAEEEKAKAESDRIRAERVKTITDTYAGEQLPETLRNVLKIVEFIADDGLKAKIKENRLFENPTIDNFEKAGIPVENIMPFAKLASAINTAKLIGTPNNNSGGDPNSFENRLAAAKRDYPNAEHMWPKQ